MDIPTGFEIIDKPTDERKVINILFIGESGIGKTTCINSIPHYLQNDNLDEALEKPLEVLIATHFTYNTKDENGEWQPNEVKIGASDNENFTAGESHTLKPQVYPIEYKDEYLVQIIDTPGINDHRGCFQDKENLQEIITFISELTHLNLIVFLLHPDKPVLSPIFEFFFKEVIMQFHRNATENIVFGFTRSSSCGFEIGQTLVPLQLLLKEFKIKHGIDIRVNDKTSYAFDNAAIRYLFIMKQEHPPSFSRKDINNFKTCFEESGLELTRLLEYAIRVEPHDPKDTAMLNFTRSVILRLAGPMAMIATSAQKTLQLIRDREAEFEMYKGEESKCKKDLYRPITIVRYCMERKESTWCQNCAIMTIYRDDARRPYIEADPELADQNPLKLWTHHDALVNDAGEHYCPECGPDFKKVVSNKVYHQLKEEKKELNQTVYSRLNGVKKSQNDVAKKLAELQDFRIELVKEREMIIKASAKFASFLKTSSIITYNDLTENYLNILIDLEEKKNGVTSELYQSLQKMKEEYLEEKRIFDENLGNASEEEDGGITPEEVNTLIKDLFKLKHYGKDIRDAFTVVKEDDGTVDDANPGGKKFSYFQTPKFLYKFFSKFFPNFM